MAKKHGMNCEEHADGSKTCKRFIAKKGNTYATGTDVDLIPDPNSCKVRTVGNIMDEDRASVEQEIKDIESRCKKGF